MSIIRKKLELNEDPLMRAIKAVRTNGGTANPNSLESLEKQRRNQEKLSKLVTPNITVKYEKSSIDYTGQPQVNNLTGDKPKPKKTRISIPTLWAKPEFAHRTDAIIVYCHGGGYTCGGLGYAGILAGKLAHHTGLEVMTFQYRLAPEHPYPAAIEDAVAIWDHLMHMGYGARDIILAGDSAGGNLALELVLTLQKQGRILPKAMILMSPWTDMTVTADSYERIGELDPMLTKDYVLGVREAYAVGMSSIPDGENNTELISSIDYSNPSLSPLYAELHDLPPIYIQVGSHEILQDDSINLYNKLKENNCQATMEIYDDCWHVFQQMPTARAARALDDVKNFVQELL